MNLSHEIYFISISYFSVVLRLFSALLQDVDSTLSDSLSVSLSLVQFFLFVQMSHSLSSPFFSVLSLSLSQFSLSSNFLSLLVLSFVQFPCSLLVLPFTQFTPSYSLSFVQVSPCLSLPLSLRSFYCLILSL